MAEWFRAHDPPPYCYLDLFSVVSSSTPRPRFRVISKLVSLLPTGTLDSLCSISVRNICLFIYSVPINTTVLNDN